MSILEEKTPSREFVMPNEVHTHTRTHTHTHTHTQTCTQVGAMVAYLCSDEARQVTGSTLTIDGGWTVR